MFSCSELIDEFETDESHGKYSLDHILNEIDTRVSDPD